MRREMTVVDDTPDPGMLLTAGMLAAMLDDIDRTAVEAVRCANALGLYRVAAGLRETSRQAKRMRVELDDAVTALAGAQEDDGLRGGP